MSTEALILAAGKSTRMEGKENKLLQIVGGLPIIMHTLNSFISHQLIDRITLVSSDENYEIFRNIVDTHPLLYDLTNIAIGGESRQKSCYEGVMSLDDEVEFVVIHDASRPFASEEVITRVINAAYECKSAIVAVPEIDTVKLVGKDGYIRKTIDRRYIWRAQTPQVFTKSLIKAAHEFAFKNGHIGTDDASLVEMLGHPVKIVEGDPANIKITAQSDMEFAQLFWSAQMKF